MTVAQLIQKLKKFDPDMPVVIKSGKVDLSEDFIDLTLSNLVELKTREVFKVPHWQTQLYDASEGLRERPTKVLSLSGGTLLQRGKNENED